MRPDYQMMSTANLVDLLAQETEKFTQLMMDRKYSDEYEYLKSRVQQIQAIIEMRRAFSAREMGTNDPTAA